MLDVIIAVIAAATQAITVYWGWRLIAVPLDPADAKRKRRFESGFIVCLTIGILAVGIAAYRSHGVSDQLAALQAGQQQTNAGIQKIEQNPPKVEMPPAAPPTEQRPKSLGFLQFDHVEFLETSIAENQQLGINIYLVNRGSEPAYTVHEYFGVRLEDAKQIDSESSSDLLDRSTDAEFLATMRRANDYKKVSQGEIGVGQNIWGTVGYKALTASQVEGISDGTVRLYLLAHARWDNAEKDLNICEWLQKPGSVEVSQWKVWHYCHL